MSENDGLARKIMKILCHLESQEATLPNLLSRLADLGGKQPDKQSLVKCLQLYPYLFKLETKKNSETRISLQVHVKICKLSKVGLCQDDASCDGLHVCVSFLLSGLCPEKGPEKCVQVHQIHTDHNKKILQAYLMDKLSKDEIRSIFRHVRNRTRSMLPSVCTQYLDAGGCSNDSCPKLHICQKYMLSSCNDSCLKNHRQIDDQAKGILKMFGLDTGKGPKEIMKDLVSMNQFARISYPQPDLKSSCGKDHTKLENTPGSDQQAKTCNSKPLTEIKKSGLKDSASDGNQGQSASDQRSLQNQTSSSLDHQNLMTQRPQLKTSRPKYRQDPSVAGCQKPQIQYPPPPLLGSALYMPTQGYLQCQPPRQRLLNPYMQSQFQHQQRAAPPMYNHYPQDLIQPQQDCSGLPPPFRQQKPLHQQAQQQNYEPSSNRKQQGKAGNPLFNAVPATSQRQIPDKKKSQICMQNFKKCYLREKCSRYHRKVTYQWQFRVNDEKGDSQMWCDFDEDSNNELETTYSDPKEDICPVAFKKGEIVTVNFDDMKGTSKRTKMIVRRLSTPSSEAPNVRSMTYKWTTLWKWFWQDECGIWTEYGEENTSKYSCDKTSETIEKSFLDNPKGTIEFSNTGGHNYRLIFDTMVQVNVSSSTQRKVRRRPKFFTKEELKTRSSPNLQFSPKTGPAKWSNGRIRNQEEMAKHYAEIKLKEASEEYKNLTSLFHETVPGDRKILSVERIENGELWMSFDMQREKMKRKAGKSVVEERQLFHGTTQDNIEAICRQGFDFRFSGFRVGAKYGKGSYFAKDAKYSDNYAEKSDKAKKIFVARVLLGEFTQGDTNYVRPPAKSTDNPHDLYDSCVDNVTDPKIFVVFTLDQAYPEYLITYS